MCVGKEPQTLVPFLAVRPALPRYRLACGTCATPGPTPTADRAGPRPAASPRSFQSPARAFARLPPAPRAARGRVAASPCVCRGVGEETRVLIVLCSPPAGAGCASRPRSVPGALHSYTRPRAHHACALLHGPSHARPVPPPPARRVILLRLGSVPFSAHHRGIHGVLCVTPSSATLPCRRISSAPFLFVGCHTPTFPGVPAPCARVSGCSRAHLASSAADGCRCSFTVPIPTLRALAPLTVDCGTASGSVGWGFGVTERRGWGLRFARAEAGVTSTMPFAGRSEAA
ncbi:hypothetical protein DFH06DRAFT_61228 [Mycena polygramma]|nr:hypothetical protein DFH06DRAFT_61228 [Mycena polygramma]